MAKLPFSKLGLKATQEIKNIDFNGQVIEVKQYLPILDKLELLQNTLILAFDENNFINPVKLKLFFELEIIEKYTNITFTEKQKEDIPKLYDLVSQNILTNIIIEAIPKVEYDYLFNSLMTISESIYKYNNSALGMVEQFLANNEDKNEDLMKMIKEIGSSDSLPMLKEILEKLG